MTFLPNYSLLGFATSESHEEFGKEQKEIVESLTKLLPNDVNESGSLRAWAFYAIDESHWPRLINKHKLLQDVEEFGILTPPLLSSPSSSASPIRSTLLHRSTPPPSLPSPLRGFNHAGVGSRMEDSLAILEWTRRTNEREAILVYRKLARKHHLDKNNIMITGMSDHEATTHFQLSRNAFSFVSENRSMF